MDEKEREVQKALGLEKGYVVKLSVEVLVYLQVPIVVKGFSEEEVRDRMLELPDNVKKQVILYMCRAIVDGRHYGRDDCRILGEEAIDEVRMISKESRRDIDPSILYNECVEIVSNPEDTDDIIETIADAMEYIQKGWELEEKEVLVI